MQTKHSPILKGSNTHQDSSVTHASFQKSREDHMFREIGKWPVVLSVEFSHIKTMMSSSSPY